MNEWRSEDRQKEGDKERKRQGSDSQIPRCSLRGEGGMGRGDTMTKKKRERERERDSVFIFL